jgi:hypothetical protein
MKRNIGVEINVVNDYLCGVNNKELCAKYNRSRGYIQNVLNRYHIKLRNASEVTKKYNINENYFEHIDCDDKAYILGLLYADGCIFKNVTRINLIETDVDILKDIASKIYFDDNYQISRLEGMSKTWKNGNTYYTKPQMVLTLTRKKIVDDLKKHGMCEKKSFTIRFPNINVKYIKDFVRGYFDGDGHFYTSEKHINNNRIQIISNNAFIDDLKKVIEENINVKCIINESEIANIYRLNIFGNVKVKKFLDWIYKDSHLKLNRKYLHYINAYQNNVN